jgi:hypothetical protein
VSTLPVERFRILAASVALAAMLNVASAAARAGDADAAAAPKPADCTIVGAAEAATLLGFGVSSADDTSRAAGICFYGASAASDDGFVSYAIVTPERLPQRRQFFRAMARRCAGVAPQAPNAAVCRTFVALSDAADPAAYFTARTDVPDAAPVAGLGDAAVAAADVLYVRRGQTVFEIAVHRDESLDLDRSCELARRLLERTAGGRRPSAS